MNIPTLFVNDAVEGKKVYDSMLAPNLKRPPLLPILEACPYYVRPSVLIKAIEYDGCVKASRKLELALKRSVVESQRYIEAATASDRELRHKLKVQFDTIIAERELLKERVRVMEIDRAEREANLQD